ncbi:D-alanine--D-alanine ligase family protein [Abyssisolibacter fermentans]|uniref:D-alanine--D-alanine ligase family protein n=1 Tax=Abyssisolibacter fermentans TaxID=1766203 RepID=UPI0008300449|nr:D-alanine--D-alanine ligase family protein [Abyssisolibacter fermentans]
MKKLVVIFGGKSPEYGVSLQSSYSVIKVLENTYDLFLIGITEEGAWYLFEGDIELIRQNKWYNTNCKKVVWSPNPKDKGFYILTEHNSELVNVDAVFPVLHGKNGEDGTIQGLLQMSEIPMIGCDMEASAICMNKRIAHNLVSLERIKVPKSIILDKYSIKNNDNELLSDMKYPLYVKPMRAGSSFGITRVENENQIKKAIEQAFAYDQKITIEETIEGFEVGCSIIGSEFLTIGSVDEIELEKRFLDYYEKYHQETLKIHVPARIPENIEQKIKEVGIKIYRTLGCKGFARIDMFLTPENEIVFNEVNTIPGFTQLSRFPKMMTGIGMDFNTLIQTIVKIEME